MEIQKSHVTSNIIVNIKQFQSLKNIPQQLAVIGYKESISKHNAIVFVPSVTV